MFGLGPLSFGAPLALLGLLALPFLWMILRATPPTPRNIVFAPLRLLQNLDRTPESSETTPWWLILLRLLLAALIIFALARPVWQPDPVSQSDDPLVIVMDDGWAGAQSWPEMQREARIRIEAARADGREVALLFTTMPEQSEPARFTAASTALAQLSAHRPRSWTPNRAEATARFERLMADPSAPRRVQSVWITDGLESDDDQDFARQLSSRGDLTVLISAQSESLAITGLEPNADGLITHLRRVESPEAQSVSVIAYSADGQAIARASGVFESQTDRLDLAMRLPLELRNQIARIGVNEANSAGLVYLTGDRWRRPRVGVIDPEGRDEGQPLLSDTHYIRQALSQSAEIVSGTIDDALESEPSALILIDSARPEVDALNTFINEGGMVIRFAGPRLANSPDDFLPVRLRQGGRLFGGALAWDDPQQMSIFSDNSPFAGLSVPDEAQITRQVLAEPGPDLSSKTWARLEDGTPLVTAERRGSGWLVLFHVTSGPDWSNLPLSGLFPAMLERTLALTNTTQAANPTSGAWQLDQLLSGNGQLTSPQRDSVTVPVEDFPSLIASAENPPGLWVIGSTQAALNTISHITQLNPIDRNLPGAITQTRGKVRELRFTAPLLSLAFLFVLADLLITLALSGRLPTGLGQSSAVVCAFLVVQSGTAEAQSIDDYAAYNALDVRFAYVITGDVQIDIMSEAGLRGVSRESTRRSAVEPADPVGINIETDEIEFFPFVYWPVTEDSPALSEAASAKVAAYLQSGGLLVFDTRSGEPTSVGREPHPGLVRILETVNPPALQRIPDDHVLGRTFYLLSDYPGRYPGGEVWVEATPEGSARDGVSGIIIGSADWAAAWAVDDNCDAMAPVEGGDFQREMSIRFGVNLAMYALTGNYKTDQVHIPAILELIGGESE